MVLNRKSDDGIVVPERVPKESRRREPDDNGRPNEQPEGERQADEHQAPRTPCHSQGVVWNTKKRGHLRPSLPPKLSWGDAARRRHEQSCRAKARAEAQRYPIEMVEETEHINGNDDQRIEDQSNGRQRFGPTRAPSAHRGDEGGRCWKETDETEKHRRRDSRFRLRRGGSHFRA